MYVSERSAKHITVGARLIKMEQQIDHLQCKLDCIIKILNSLVYKDIQDVQ